MIALPHYTTGTWVLLIVAALVVLSVLAAFLGRVLIRRGLREPFVVRLINRTSERIVTVIKRPITIAVLDEVADVLRIGPLHAQHRLGAAREPRRAQGHVRGEDQG